MAVGPNPQPSRCRRLRRYSCARDAPAGRRDGHCDRRQARGGKRACTICQCCTAPAGRQLCAKQKPPSTPRHPRLAQGLPRVLSALHRPPAPAPAPSPRCRRPLKACTTIHQGGGWGRPLACWHVHALEPLGPPQQAQHSTACTTGQQPAFVTASAALIPKAQRWICWGWVRAAWCRCQTAR
jgi:hypothetical protein